jgi:hypothetical protein
VFIPITKQTTKTSSVWIGGKEETGVLEDKRIISMVIWLQHAESKNQGELPGVTNMAVKELEEITCLTIASRSLIVMKVEPLVAAATVTEKEPCFDIILDLENPSFGLGGRVRQCSRIWLKA